MDALPLETLERTLRYRLPMMRGDDVRAVQARLFRLGYGREVGADGLFGPNTRAAVQDFQRAHGLVADGVVGQRTRAALAATSAKPEPAGPAAVPPPVRRSTFAAAPPAVVPEAWLPAASPTRVICHWTAGAYGASDLDKRHYHLLVEGDGTVRRGDHAISANDRPIRGAYAPHTRSLNTGSIGVAVCAMAGARERPFDPGRFPLRRDQWRRMAAVVAQLCHRYDLPVTPETVLGHGEVERRLGVPQRAKWDPLRLPWRPELDLDGAGDAFRDEVRGLLAQAEEPEPPVELATDLDGRELAGAIDFDCHVRLAIAALLDDPRFTAAEVDDDEITLVFENREPLYLAWDIAPGTVPAPGLGARDAAHRHGYVRAEDVAIGLGFDIAVREGRLVLGRPEVPVAVAGGRFEPVVLGAGDTLRALAARHLGDAARWSEIRDRDGEAISAERARTLAAGATVLVPRAEGAAAARRVSDGERAALLACAWPWQREWAEEAIALLVTACRADGLDDPGQIAYVLATAEHESHFGKYMVERGDAATWRAYEGRYGNDGPGDGKRYRGRGYVQITFKANYAKFDEVVGADLVADPGRAADPEVAARIAVIGMRDGMFRNERLADYVAGARRDFVGARAVINNDADRLDAWDETGTPRGPRIAARAERFLAALG